MSDRAASVVWSDSYEVDIGDHVFPTAKYGLVKDRLLADGTITADQLGGLALTKAGLRARDEAVLAAARGAGVPVAVTLAGGYAIKLTDTVDIHCATVEAALAAHT